MSPQAGHCKSSRRIQLMRSACTRRIQHSRLSILAISAVITPRCTIIRGWAAYRMQGWAMAQELYQTHAASAHKAQATRFVALPHARRHQRGSASPGHHRRHHCRNRHRRLNSRRRRRLRHRHSPHASITAGRTTMMASATMAASSPIIARARMDTTAPIAAGARMRTTSTLIARGTASNRIPATRYDVRAHLCATVVST